MSFIRRLLREQHAASTVDFAFALPVLATIMLGTMQLGQYFHVSGSLQHALGEGIRLAKVDPTATSTEIRAEVEDEMAAIDTSNITGFAFVRGTSSGIDYGAVAIRYQLEPMIPLVPVSAITIQEVKVAYLPVGG